MTLTGTATINNKERGHEIVQAINAYTVASLIVDNPDYSDQATLNANLLKSVIKTHNTYSNVIFRGELRKMSTRTGLVEYQALDKARKLLSQKANYDAAVDSGVIRQMTATTLRDASKFFGTSSELVGHLLHFWKSTTLDRLRVSPNNTESIRTYSNGASAELKNDDGAGPTLGFESGDIIDTYRGLPNEIRYPGDDNYIRWEGLFSGTQDWGLYVDCYFALLSGVSISSIESVAVNLSVRRLSALNLLDNTQQDPFIGLWDFSLGRYEGVYIRKDDVGGRFVNYVEGTTGSSVKMAPWIVKALTSEDLAQAVDNYTQTVVTTGDYTVYKIRVFIGAGIQLLTETRVIKLRNIYVNLKLSGDQKPTRGVETIASHTNTEITFGSLGGDGEVPLYDGCGLGDSYIITDTLDDQINTLATQWSITINDNITNAGTLALTQDFTYKTRLDVFQEICRISNSIWYYQPSEDAFYIVSADNLVSTGVTITKADIVGWERGNWEYVIDADNIRDEILFKGDSHFGDETVTIASPEFSHALGDEQVILKRPNITSNYHLTKEAAAETPKYQYARRYAKFQLDYDNPAQSYTALEIGKTLILKLPDASDTTIANHVDPHSPGSGTYGEMLITSMYWQKNEQSGFRRLVTIECEGRYS